MGCWLSARSAHTTHQDPEKEVLILLGVGVDRRGGTRRKRTLKSVPKTLFFAWPVALH